MKLFGDGIHDDTLAIQELLDSRKSQITLPVPEKHYLISQTLRIHSCQELKLSRYTCVKLAANSNCYMITNADAEEGNENITISGGIWDYNNLEQNPNPATVPRKKPISISRYDCDYNGIAIYFYNVKNLTVRNLTLKDPVTYACTLDMVSYFTVENIQFDFNYGNPFAQNMDGIHMNGNCHFGLIQNLKGACYDDLVALNADEGSDGPISNIRIDGIYAEDCQSAVRLLTRTKPVEHIHISNVFGTYYTYCIALTKFRFDVETKGYFDGVVLDNIHVSKAVLIPEYNKEEIYGIQPIILIERQTVTKALSISNLHRTERNTAVPTIELQPEAYVDKLQLIGCYNKSEMGKCFPFVQNGGTIKNLSMNDVYNDNGEIWAGNEAENVV